jgi:hypothetical protein
MIQQGLRPALEPGRSKPCPLGKVQMKNKDKDDYKVGFSGATISKNEANKVGVALIFGLIGIVAIGLAFGIQNKLTIFMISVGLACIGYFGIANRLFKK